MPYFTKFPMTLQTETSDFLKQIFFLKSFISLCYRRIKNIDPPCKADGFLWKGILTHCLLADSSTVICWTSPFVILEMSDLFYHYYSVFDGKSF